MNLDLLRGWIEGYRRGFSCFTVLSFQPGKKSLLPQRLDGAFNRFHRYLGQNNQPRFSKIRLTTLGITFQFLLQPHRIKEGDRVANAVFGFYLSA